MNLSRIVAKQFAGFSTVKAFPKMNLGKLEQDAEWIKWLTYSLLQRKEQVTELKQKDIDLLSAKELEFLLNYAQDEKILASLNHVRNSVASADEAMEVYDFLKTNSIVRFMERTLPVADLKLAKEWLHAIEAMDKDAKAEYLREKLSPGQYEQLSMVDAYVVHIVLYHDMVESEKRCDREIRARVKENNDMAFRSGRNARRNY